MADERSRTDPGKIRQRMRRLYTKLKRQCASLKEHKEDTPVTELPLYSIDRVAADTETEKSLYDNMLQDLLDVEPDEDARAQDEERINCVKEDLDSLKRALEKSPMELDHPQRRGAEKALDSTYLLLSDLKKPALPREMKPLLEEGGAGIKMTPFNPPRFSGDQKDWISFRSEFKSIHDSHRYAPATKLSYLRQAMVNPSLRRQVGICVDNGDSYDQVMKMLQDQFDRPRLTHKIYVDQLLAIGQVKPHKSAILECANTLQSVWDGLTKLGPCDAQSIFTTIVESWLPKELRIRWEDETISSKSVPQVKSLISFLRLRATQPQYEDKGHHTTSGSERKAPQRQKSVSHHASVHVVSGQPVQPNEPQSELGTPNYSQKGNSRFQKQRGQPFTQCKYTCPLCQEAHYAYSCKLFKEKPVSQRMEYVAAQSLCSKCLKFGHSSDMCRNPRTCSVCKGDHNTLLHQNSSPPVVSGTVNNISDTSPVNSLRNNKLLMTCQALIVGKKGKSMPVRMLLDSGADISYITSQIAKHLELRPLEAVAVAVKPCGPGEQYVCQSVDFTICPLSDSGWKLDMSAVILDRITGIQPRQDAAAVKEMALKEGWV